MRYSASQKNRAETYAKSRGISIDFTLQPLGNGTDGAVFKSSRQTAVKVFEGSKQFILEKQCYQRFENLKIISIHGYNVPEIQDSDDRLLIIEMTIVRPPFVLDFGKVALDQAPDYPPEAWAERQEYWADLFEDHWPTVKKILSTLRSMGIYYLDPKPGNITPPDWNPTL